jgi:hypothetical protein
MITTREAATEIERMSGMKFYPRGADQEPALLELCHELERADTAQIAKRVIDDVLGYETEAPTPAVIRRMVFDANEKAKPPARSEQRPSAGRCPNCEGTGVLAGLAFGPPRMCAPATWCECSAGRIRKHEEPDYVDRVNIARDKLLKRFAGKKSAPGDIKPAAEVYHGDF